VKAICLSYCDGHVMKGVHLFAGSKKTIEASVGGKEGTDGSYI